MDTELYFTSNLSGPSLLILELRERPSIRLTVHRVHFQNGLVRATLRALTSFACSSQSQSNCPNRTRMNYMQCTRFSKNSGRLSRKPMFVNSNASSRIETFMTNHPLCSSVAHANNFRLTFRPRHKPQCCARPICNVRPKYANSFCYKKNEFVCDVHCNCSFHCIFSFVSHQIVFISGKCKWIS
jgi:hypothetical protein